VAKEITKEQIDRDVLELALLIYDIFTEENTKTIIKKEEPGK